MPTPDVSPQVVMQERERVLNLLPQKTLARPFLFRYKDGLWETAFSRRFFGHDADDIFSMKHVDLGQIKSVIVNQVKGKE